MSINIVRRLSGDLRQILMTFDDGPDPEHTPQVLDILAAAQVRAIFFVVGTAARRHAALVRRILAEGHEIGNHTWSHHHPWLVRTSVACREVAQATDALADIVGRRPRYFRPPFGRLRRVMIDAAQELEQTVVLWSLSGRDWGPWGRAALIAKRLARAQPGDIILLHDARWHHNRPWEMLATLADFLAGLSGKDLLSAPLSYKPPPILHEPSAQASAF
ncbi:MAG TPA: polysaccharide deacetylase family protein [Gammaproteobacteria bacterium]|nr:polysaccharide deacetylase family protein [Gammaproteobacteria bacterium]